MSIILLLNIYFVLLMKSHMILGYIPGLRHYGHIVLTDGNGLRWNSLASHVMCIGERLDFIIKSFFSKPQPIYISWILYSYYGTISICTCLTFLFSLFSFSHIFASRFLFSFQIFYVRYIGNSLCVLLTKGDPCFSSDGSGFKAEKHWSSSKSRVLHV